MYMLHFAIEMGCIQCLVDNGYVVWKVILRLLIVVFSKNRIGLHRYVLCFS